MKKTNTSSTPTPESLLQHASWTHALARSLVGEAAADDLVQETWVAALQSGPALDRPLKPWLGTVLGNFARQSWRSSSRRQERERLAAVQEAQPSAAELTERAELQKRLMEEVLGLDEELREVLLLKFFEGCSAAQIARRKGLPASTVKSRLQRGLEELRCSLDGAFGGDRESWGIAFLPLLRAASQHDTPVLGSAGALGWAALSKASVLLLALALGAFALLFAVSSGAFDSEEISIEAVTFRPLEVEPPEATLGAALTDSRRLVQAELPPAQVEPGAASVSRVLARFLDQNGAPVAGVQFSRWGRQSAAGAASGTDGRLDYALETRRAGSTVFLSYHHPALATDSISFDLEPGSVHDLGDIVVHPGGGLRGRVVDENGAPLVGAKVLVRGQEISRAAPGNMMSYTNTSLGQVDGMTNEAGEFALRGVLAGDVRVEVTHLQGLHNTKSGWVEVRPGEESVGLEIVAPAAPLEQRIEGFVFDPQGNPLSGVTVDMRYRSFFGGGGSMSHSADASGFFRFVNDVDTGHDLVFRAPSRFGWAPVVMEDVELGRVGLRIQFEVSESFVLRVVDESGAGVEDFACTLLDESGKHVMQRIERATHADGRVELWQPAGGYQVRVDAPGFSLAEVQVGRGKSLSVGLKLMSLTRLPGVHGRVTYAGQPLAGAQLYLQRTASDARTYNGFPVRFESRFVERTTSDEDGEFHFTLRESGTYVVRATATDLAPLEFGPQQLSRRRGASNLDLAMTTGGSIHGRVQLAPGSSPAGKIVAVTRGDCWAETRRVGSDGAFAFDGLIPGPWQVELVDAEVSDGESSSTSDGFQAAHDVVASNCVVHEGQVTRQDVALGSTQVSTLEGQLELGSLDMSDWRGRLTPLDGGLPVDFALDEHGRFEAHVAEPGPWNLSVARGESGGLRLAASLELQPGLNEWKRQIAVTSVRLRGSAPATCTYVWRGAQGVQAIHELADDGSTDQLLEVVPVGPARLVVFEQGAPTGDPSSWPTWMELEVLAGTRGEVDLR